MRELDKYNPIKDTFNAISLSCNPTEPINHLGYTLSKSENKANNHDKH